LKQDFKAFYPELQSFSEGTLVEILENNQPTNELGEL
jgi:hypothetical protein